MNVVVLDHAGDECQHAGGKQKRPVAQPAGPLNEKADTQQREKGQRTQICRMAQRHQSNTARGRLEPLPTALEDWRIWNCCLHSPDSKPRCGSKTTRKHSMTHRKMCAVYRNYRTLRHAIPLEPAWNGAYRLSQRKSHTAIYARAKTQNCAGFSKGTA